MDSDSDSQDDENTSNEMQCYKELMNQSIDPLQWFNLNVYNVYINVCILTYIYIYIYTLYIYTLIYNNMHTFTF